MLNVTREYVEIILIPANVIISIPVMCSKIAIVHVYLILEVNLNCVFCLHSCKAGQTVQMSSLLLGDPSKAYFKLTLWREAAAWVERIAAGDIAYFRSML